MPAKIVIDRATPNTSLEAFEEHLRSICGKHLKALHELRVERRNRGAGSGPISEVVEVARDPDESDADLVDSVVKQVLAVVVRDSQVPRGRSTPGAGRVGAWHGEVILYAKGTPPKEITRVPAQLEDPDAFQSFEQEGVALLGQAVKLVDGMRKIVVDLGTTFVKREKSMNKLVRSVAKTNARSSKYAARFDYKKSKVEARAQETESEATRRAQQTRARMEAMSDIADSYADTARVWSEYVIRRKERKPGEPQPQPPTRPTQAELDTIFGVEAFEENVNVVIGGENVGQWNARTASATLIAESDFKRRQDLAKILVHVLVAYGLERQQLMAQRAVEGLGEDRALQIKAWLSVPLT